MSKFSDFFNYASDEEKEKVYMEVLDESIKEQIGMNTNCLDEIEKIARLSINDETRLLARMIHSKLYLLESRINDLYKSYMKDKKTANYEKYLGMTKDELIDELMGK